MQYNHGWTAASLLFFWVFAHFFLSPLFSELSGGEGWTYHHILLPLAMIYYFLSFGSPKTWVCENCQEESAREEIKFGLCPKCGTKMKNFRGLVPRIY